MSRLELNLVEVLAHCLRNGYECDLMDEMLSSSLCCSNHCMNFFKLAFHLDPLDELGEECLSSFLTRVDEVSIACFDCILRYREI